MAQTKETTERIDKLRLLSEKGRLPPMAQTEHDSYHEQFHVYLLKNSFPPYFGFWVFSIMACLSLPSTLTCLTDAAASLAEKAANVGETAFLVFVAGALRKAKKEILADPVILRVYTQGIWIRLAKVFIPYERLVKIETGSVSVKWGPRSRYTTFHALLENEEIKRFTIRNGGLSVSFGEILDRIYELASEYNKKRHLPPPQLLVDGVELTDEEFRELKSGADDCEQE